MRIGQLIESIPSGSGGTTTAFFGTLSCIDAGAGGASWLAFTLRPPEGDPAWSRIAQAPERWRLAGSVGRLRSGELGRLAAAAALAGEIDVLHIHGMWCADHRAAVNACVRAGVGVVWEPHGMLMGEAMARGRLKKQAFLAAGGRRALCSAGSLLFVTDHERDHSVVPASIGPERRDVAPLAVEAPPGRIDAAYRASARERFGIPPGAPTVVFMGRLHPVKRLDLLLGAMADTGDASARLLIAGGAGPGDEAHAAGLRELASRLGLGERAVFAGWVRGEDKWRALACGDVLSLQSVHENFGFVALEALYAGARPVMTSNLALAGELDRAGLALVCEPTRDALAGALARGLRERDPAGVLARGGAYVREHFSPEAVGARLARIYARVARGRS